MAAGRVDVTRREDTYFSSRKDLYNKNRYHDLELNHDFDRNLKRRNGWEGVDEGRSFRGKSRYNDTISRSEDEPAAKRIKFSPTRKEIRISSRNRIVEKRTPRFPSPSPAKLCDKINNFIADDVSKSPRGTTQPQSKKVSPVEACLASFESESLANSSSLSYSNIFSKNNGDDDEGAEVQPISKSRWANEEYSPPQNKSSNNGSISPRKVEVDTPESGEICETNSGSEQLNDEVESLVFPEGCLDMKAENDNFAPEGKCVNMLQACRSVREYEKIKRISEGTYGIVYKARDRETNEIVALKKVKMANEREGFPITALREINILLALHHPSIVNVKEIVMDDNNDVYMVMEYMEYDLRRLIDVMKQPFTEKEVKCLMLQLLEGIKDLHDNWILHRDLKTSNILISKNGKLKICDFGMSRQYGSPLKPFTSLVVTLWYRAPELLLGAKKYSTAVDMWSVGCIMAELLLKKALFDGENEVRQLDKIFRMLGTPTEVSWPGLANLPGAKANFVKQARNTLRDKFPALSFNGSTVLSERGFDLLSQLLTMDPEKRITIDDALAHGWFGVESKQELASAQESLARRIKTLTRVWWCHLWDHYRSKRARTFVFVWYYQNSYPCMLQILYIDLNMNENFLNFYFFVRVVFSVL